MSQADEVKTNDRNVKANGGLPANHRRRAILGLVVFLLIAGIAGILYWLHARVRVSTDDAFIEAHIISISPRVSGQVLKVHVKSNQEVKQGDLLMEIDPRDCQVRLDQARAMLQAALARQKSARINVGLTETTSTAMMDQAAAALQTAKAQAATAHSRWEQAQAQVTAAQAAVQQAKAQVSAAEAEATRAQADLQRYRQLMEKDEVSRQQFDHVNTADQAAAAQLESARKRVVAAEAQVQESEAAARAAESSCKETESKVNEAQARLVAAKTAPQQVALSQSQEETSSADLTQLRAAVQQAELELSYTRVCAPEAGRVTHKSVEDGIFVSVGQAVMAIVPPEVWVVANFKETQLALIRPGQAVDIEVDSFPDRDLKGHVDSIQAGTGSRFSLLPPENATGNYIKVIQRVPVKILFDEPPEALRLLAPGMSVVPEVKVR